MGAKGSKVKRAAPSSSKGILRRAYGANQAEINLAEKQWRENQWTVKTHISLDEAAHQLEIFHDRFFSTRNHYDFILDDETRDLIQKYSKEVEEEEPTPSPPPPPSSFTSQSSSSSSSSSSLEEVASSSSSPSPSPSSPPPPPPFPTNKKMTFHTWKYLTTKYLQKIENQMKAEDQLYDGKKEEDEEEEWEGLLSTRGKSYISYPFDGVDVIREFRNLVGNKHIKGQQKERLLTIMTMHPGFCVSFDECGKSTLEYLIEGNNIDLVDFSLEHGADVNFYHKKQKIGTLDVGAKASLEMLKFLMENGAGVPTEETLDKCSSYPHFCELFLFIFPLIEETIKNPEELLQKLIKHRKNEPFPKEIWKMLAPKIDPTTELKPLTYTISRRDTAKKTSLLHSCFFWNQKDVADFLVQEKGQFINQIMDGFSTFAFAIMGVKHHHRENFAEDLEAWIERGANIDFGEGEKVPIVMAVRSGNAPLVKYLTAHNVKLNVDLPEKQSLFHLSDNATIDKALIEAGMLFSQLNEHHETSMMAHFRRTTEQSFARPFASREQLKTFLNNGGDPNIPDLKKRTLLYYAVQKESADFLKMLLNHKADISLVQPSALIIAVKFGRGQEVIPLLLQKGCDTDARDEKGKTALQLAEDLRKIVAVSQIKNHKPPQINIKRAK